ncbi:MAG: transposase [Planctomycetota bacterium]
MSTHHGILINLVFFIKHRKLRFHNDWRGDLLLYIGGMLRDHKSVLLTAGGIEDHVHPLIRIRPGFAISKTVQQLKANFSR